MVIVFFQGFPKVFNVGHLEVVKCSELLKQIVNVNSKNDNILTSSCNILDYKTH